MSLSANCQEKLVRKERKEKRLSTVGGDVSPHWLPPSAFGGKEKPFGKKNVCDIIPGPRQGSRVQLLGPDQAHIGLVPLVVESEVVNSGHFPMHQALSSAENDP